MMGSANHGFFPGAVRGDMLFSEAYYRQSGRIFDDQLFSSAALAESADAGTAGSDDGPVLPPSAGYISWVNEAEDMKQRASFAVHGGHGDEAPAGVHGGHGDEALAGWGDGQGGFSPDWWCPEHQRQLGLYVDEQAALVPPAVSWDVFGQADACPCLAWTACDVDGAADGLAAAQPLILPDEAPYPPLLDDMEMGLDPYPEMEVGPLAAATKPWPASPPPYVFPHAVEGTTPFLLSEASSPSSEASLSNESDSSDLEARFASNLSLSTTAERAGDAPCSGRVLRSASSSPGRKGKPASGAPATRARASRSRKRLPSVPPELPAAVHGAASRARRMVRLSCRRAPTRSRSSSASSVKQEDEGVQGWGGPPYDKIDDMDAVSKSILERTLLADRDGHRSRKVPYSVIQAKLRHLYGGAEETLRGHHRRLVLPKEQRVRRPVWLPRDDALLQQAVRLQRTACPRAKKIAWTAISRFLQDNGSSYRFGVTTCSRRYRMLQSGEVARGQ